MSEETILELAPPSWRRMVVVWLAAISVAGALLSAAVFLTEHYASAEDVERAEAEHREEHRILDSRIEAAERRAAVNDALLERVEKTVERIDEKLTDYPIERHGR